MQGGQGCCKGRDLRKRSLFPPAPLNRSFKLILLCHHITNGAGAIRTHDRRVWSPLPFQTRPRPHATYYIYNYIYLFNISTRLYRVPREIITMLIKPVSCIRNHSLSSPQISIIRSSPSLGPRIINKSPYLISTLPEGL